MKISIILKLIGIGLASVLVYNNFKLRRQVESMRNNPGLYATTEEVSMNTKFELGSLYNFNEVNNIFSNPDLRIINLNKDTIKFVKNQLVLRIPSPICSPCLDGFFQEISEIMNKEEINFMILIDPSMARNYLEYFE